MGAMTNAMGSIGGAINKVGRGAVGGVQKVGGQMGVPGLGGKPQQPGAPAQPGQPGGQVAVGPTAATAQPGEGGAPPQGTGPAGGGGGLQGLQPGQIGAGPGGPGVGAAMGAAAPFLPGGLPGMKRQLLQNSTQLTAQGALGKQPAQTTMQRMIARRPATSVSWEYGQRQQQPSPGTPGAINENFPTKAQF